MNPSKADLYVLLATKLCELGEADDPRVQSLKSADVLEIARGPDRVFDGSRIMRPLTAVEARRIVMKYLG